MKPLSDEAESRLIGAGILAYIVVAIITFGHSFNNMRVVDDGVGRAIFSVPCAAAWPLYWSAEAFEPDAPQQVERP